jgi:tetratricopeptide (TPR) repeat protein
VKEFEARDEFERLSRVISPSSPPPDIHASPKAIEFLRTAQARYPANFWTNTHLGLALHVNQPKSLKEEAVGFFRAAVAVRPDSPGARVNLGRVLSDIGRLDEAIAAYRKAIDLKPDYAAAHTNLGCVLHDKGMLEEAITEYRKAIELKPSLAEAHSNLGHALCEKGMLEEAIAEGSKAIALKPDFAGAHCNLGNALHQKGTLDEAIAEYRKATDLQQDYGEAHCNLGDLLRKKGLLDEAIKECQKALEIKPRLPEAHVNLGAALQDKGLLDEAITEYRKAIALNPDNVDARTSLGGALVLEGLRDEAISELRKALELKPDQWETHVNLGAALIEKGILDEGITECRRAIKLNPDAAAARHNLDKALRWVKAEAKLSAILKGEVQPADVAERIALASLCQEEFKKLYVASFRFYVDAFAAQPQLADDFENAHRHNAACAAAMAGCGQGKEADQIDDKERARLRGLALDWLRADLAAYRKWLDKEPDKARPVVAERMTHWQYDTDIAGVRGSKALAKLPKAEQAEWTKLWQDVAALGKKAAGK